jgi:DNA-directed RNA polymerase specialized sigma24 family protein
VKALEREPDDRLLIEAAQRERSEFTELYERNFQRIYAYLARGVATRQEAEDLTAEVFHQALESLQKFRWQGAPFLSWLYGIAANVLASHWQKLGRNPEQLAEDWKQVEPTKLNAAPSSASWWICSCQNSGWSLCGASSSSEAFAKLR